MLTGAALRCGEFHERVIPFFLRFLGFHPFFIVPVAKVRATRSRNECWSKRSMYFSYKQVYLSIFGGSQTLWVGKQKEQMKGI